MYETLSELLTIKPRILLVEDDPVARVSYQALLLEWGYEPVLAMGKGSALQDNARNKAREKRCSLAIIDLRLMDNDDESDISGLTLAEDLMAGYSIFTIVLSGHDNPESLRKVMDHPSIPFIGKQDRRSDIQQKLDEKAKRVCAVKRDIKFIDTEIIDEFLQSELVCQMGEYADQLVNILARMFPNAKSLAFEQLLSPGSTISSATRPNSVVLKVYEDDLEACIVKLGRATKIQKEARNFRRYISRKFTEGLNPQQIGKEEIAWDIGGIAYTYQGGNNATTFSNYYKEQDIVNIREVLSYFFLGTWKRYYKPEGRQHNSLPVEASNTSLYALYTSTWGVEWYEKKVREISKKTLKRIEPTLSVYSLPQPILWLEKKLANGDREFQPNNTVLTAITHGDLHGDNLLIDSRRNIWVIDFERCGEGHALQDFIELEVDILNRLEIQGDIETDYLKMCIKLFKQDKIQELREAETSFGDAQFDKAMNTISIIRGLASQCVDNVNTREYLIGLLFNMLFRAALIHEEDPEKSLRPLILAGFICHRLDNWSISWPPIEWNFN